MNKFEHDCCLDCQLANDYLDIDPSDFDLWISFADKYPDDFRNVLVTDGLHYEVMTYTPAYQDADDALPATHWRYLPLFNNKIDAITSTSDAAIKPDCKPYRGDCILLTDADGNVTKYEYIGEK